MNQASSNRSRRVVGVVIAVLLLAGAGLFIVSLRSLRPQEANGDVGKGEKAPAPVPASTATIDAILNSAHEYMKREEPAKAEAVLAAATREHPEEQGLHVMHAEALAALQRGEEAYAAYERALAVGPREGEIEFAAGTLASMLGKLDRAVEHYQAAQTSTKSDPRPSLFLAQVLVKQRKPTEAAASLAVAARLGPELAVVWGTWAQIELDANRATLAQQHAARARELEPRVTLWRLLEARALLRQNQAEGALALLVGLDELEKRDPVVLGAIGESLGMLGRPGEAADLYVKAAAADTSNGQLWLDTALWLERAGRGDEAVHHAKHAAMLATPGAREVAARLERK